MNRFQASGVRIILARLTLITLCVFLSPITGQSAELKTAPGPSAQRPRIGLVLSGGGARGAAHIGVLKLIEALNVPIDCIAGTSMGAIVGGLYAAGLTVEELEKAITSINWTEAFSDAPPRDMRSFRRKRDDDNFLVKAKPGFSAGKVKLPLGVLQGQQLTLILRKLSARASHIQDFDELKIPYRAVATDIGTGTAVILGSGDLAAAMRASMSIPSALAPVEIDGKLLVDGGVSDNLPIDIARQICADVVIAVSIGTPLEPTEKLTSVLSITGQLTTIMTQQNTQYQLRTLKHGDILIEPELGDLTTTSFDRAAEAIPIGFKAAQAKQVELQRLALPAGTYQATRAIQTSPDNPTPVIDFIRIENNSRLSERVLRSRLRIQPGERLDIAVLEKDLATIYGLDNFERVDYALVRENGKTGLVIKAVAKTWGPNYLQFGLNLAANFDGDSAFNIGLGYLKTEINSLGGEWRILTALGNDVLLFTDFYQPLTEDGRYFLVPAAAHEAFNVGFTTEGSGQGGYRITRNRVEMTGGLNLSNWGELRLGLRWAGGDVENKGNAPPLTDDRFTDAGYLVRFSTDTLDNVNFPRHGALTRLEYYASLKALGADADFAMLSFTGGWPQTWGKHTVVPILRLGSRLDGDLAIQNQFYLGGFLNLSGYQSNALAGQYAGLAELLYYYRLDNASAAFTLPVYAGGSIEIGGVWQDRDAIDFDSLIAAGSLFLGLDTPIGPLYVGGGLAERGESSMYMYLGRTF